MFRQEILLGQLADDATLFFKRFLK